MILRFAVVLLAAWTSAKLFGALPVDLFSVLVVSALFACRWPAVFLTALIAGLLSALFLGSSTLGPHLFGYGVAAILLWDSRPKAPPTLLLSALFTLLCSAISGVIILGVTHPGLLLLRVLLATCWSIPFFALLRPYTPRFGYVTAKS